MTDDLLYAAVFSVYDSQRLRWVNATLGQTEFDVIYYLMQDPNNLLDAEGKNLSAAIRLAMHNNALLILVSGPEALCATRLYPTLPDNEASYGGILVAAERLVGAYMKGIIIRVPLTCEDAKIKELLAMTEIPVGGHDYRFSLADVAEVAKILAEAGNSAWYGSHNMDSGSPLKLSNYVPVRGNVSPIIYDYSLSPCRSLLPRLPTPAFRVWDKLKGISSENKNRADRQR
jgi:hypothetical protein